MIADPLRLHDCSLVTDGAAALVIMREEDATKKGGKAVQIAGIGHVNERIAISKRENMHELIAGKEAVRRAFAEAKVGSADIDLAEVHDCFTINQVLTTEALGLSKDGRAGLDYQEGRFTKDDDKACVNLSGGLKAKGHPVGATGVSMHALLFKQLVGEAIGATPSKVKPEIGVVFNVGGSAVTNCVTVLKRNR
jgi:acetyl-CoA C-acetyltransferase